MHSKNAKYPKDEEHSKDARYSKNTKHSKNARYPEGPRSYFCRRATHSIPHSSDFPLAVERLSI